MPQAYQATLSNYRYQSLAENSIRLLRVLPAKHGLYEDIQSEVFTDSLLEPIIFDAVSYSWGNIEEADERKVVLDGSPFTVSPNLYSLLEHLRDSGWTKPIWIDFICIDQQNAVEKSRQIAMMGDIYSKADEVLIWLGEHVTPDTLPACMTRELTDDERVWFGDSKDQCKVDSIEATFRQFSEAPLSMRAGYPQNYLAACLAAIHQLAAGRHLSDIPMLTHDFYRAQILLELQCLLDSKWWNRIWVVQESVLPATATLLYGAVQLPWSLLGRAAVTVAAHAATCCARTAAHTLRVFAARVLDIEDARARWRSDTTLTLLSLANQFRSRDATDPRDKVFALVGLVRDWGGAAPFVADYGLSLYAVYRDVLEHAVRCAGTWKVLVGSGGIGAGRGYLPSWMPNWQQPFEEGGMERVRRAEMYDASAGRAPVVKFPTQEKDVILRVVGVKVDRVLLRGEAMEQTDDVGIITTFHAWTTLLEEVWLGRAGIRRRGTVFVHPQHSHYWRAICADTLHHLTDDDGVEHKRTESSRSEGFYSRLPGNSSVHDSVPEFDRSVRTATMGRAFFVTEEGRFGLGPSTLAVGDDICVLLGGTVPFALRPKPMRRLPGQAEIYLLVGDCYVHGIMDGEAMKMDHLQEETLKLA